MTAAQDTKPARTSAVRGEPHWETGEQGLHLAWFSRSGVGRLPGSAPAGTASVGDPSPDKNAHPSRLDECVVAKVIEADALTTRRCALPAGQRRRERCQPCRGWWLASALGRPARRRVTSCACRARIGDRSSFGLRNCETALLQASRGWGRPRSEVAQRKQCLSRVAVAASGENQPEARLIMRAAMATTCATIRASRDPVELKRATILLGQPARRELEVSVKPGT